MAKTNKRAKPRINAGEIVLSALKKLMRNTGWTTRTIVKFIKSEYKINDPYLGRKVSRALKRYSTRGLVQKESGRYRLHHASGMVRCASSRVLRRSKPCYLRRRASRRRARARRSCGRSRSRPRPRKARPAGRGLTIRSRSCSPRNRRR